MNNTEYFPAKIDTHGKHLARKKQKRHHSLQQRKNCSVEESEIIFQEGKRDYSVLEKRAVFYGGLGTSVDADILRKTFKITIS